MDSKKMLNALEWIFTILMISMIMFFGRIRMHQTDIKKFLIFSYLVVVSIIIVLFWIKNKSLISKKK